MLVCPSIRPVPDPESRMEGHSKLKIGKKETHDRDDPRPHLEVKRSNVEVIRPLRRNRQLVCFTGMLMSNERIVYYYMTPKLKALGVCSICK